MGWLISYDLTKEQQVAELVAGWEKDGKGLKALAHSVRGNVLFVVFQNYTVGEPERFEDRFIAVILLRKDRGMGWGYKDMTESCGPVETNCPLKFLDMAPCPNEWGREWREKVRATHEKRRKRSSVKIEPGLRFRFAPGFRAAGESLDGTEATILRKSGRGYIAEIGYMTIKVMRRHIGEVLPNAEEAQATA